MGAHVVKRLKVSLHRFKKWLESKLWGFWGIFEKVTTKVIIFTPFTLCTPLFVSDETRANIINAVTPLLLCMLISLFLVVRRSSKLEIPDIFQPEFSSTIKMADESHLEAIKRLSEDYFGPNANNYGLVDELYPKAPEGIFVACDVDNYVIGFLDAYLLMKTENAVKFEKGELQEDQLTSNDFGSIKDVSADSIIYMAGIAVKEIQKNHTCLARRLIKELLQTIDKALQAKGLEQINFFTVAYTPRGDFLCRRLRFQHDNIRRSDGNKGYRKTFNRKELHELGQQLACQVVD